MKAEPGAEAREIHYEETTWKARPDFSPDGKRIVYASYLGQQWHQLWVMPSEAAMRFRFRTATSTMSRRAGRRMESGSLSFPIAAATLPYGQQTVPGGAQTQLVAKEKHYLKPVGQLNIAVLDPSWTSHSRARYS